MTQLRVWDRMQTRVSRLAQSATEAMSESPDVLGRVMDAAKPEGVSIDKNFSSRSVESGSSCSALNQAVLEALLGRQIIQSLSTSAPLETVLFEIAAILGDAYGASACLVSIQTDCTSQTLGSWFASAQIAIAQQAEILSNYASVKTATLKNPGVLKVSDAGTSENTGLWQIASVPAVLSVTTEFQGQVNGIITLMRSQPQSWSDFETDVLTRISDYVAVSISQVLLQQRVTKQARYQALLRQVTLAIQDSIDLPQTLQFVVNGTAEALQVERAFLLRIKFWDPRQSIRSSERTPKARVMIDCEWQSERLTSAPDETALSQSFWVSECALCQTALRSTAKSLTFSEKGDFPQAIEGVGIAPIFDPDQMPALLLVPLESKNRLLGFVALQQRTGRSWQPEDAELVELVGAQISSAIIQTETLRQVESLVEERTAQLQQSLELQSKLYEITRKQIEKLRVMNQRMDEFLSTLSHELRTPLTSMMLAIRMLRQVNLTADRRQQYLNILEQQCAQETSLINDLLALQELESKQVALQLQRVDLHRVIDDVSQSFAQRWSSKGLQLELDLPKRAPIFNTDLASLNRILLELLTNAGKYADPNSVVRLKVAPQPEQQIQLTLTNVGSGISDEELPHIFEKFRRCQGMTQNAVPGTGLGLALVKSLVQHLNGTIAATSGVVEASQAYETCFTLTLPLNLEIAGS